ncbi:MAG: hypothetical protein Q9187_006450 [Circinaria calcarea]
MVIPRENNMVRLYIQLASSTDKDWDPRKKVSEAEVQASAKKILQPYRIEWDRIEWYSVYPIRQGIAEKYTLDYRCKRLDLAEDSGSDLTIYEQPKAGQGMNAAFHDAINLAWKIHHVEGRFADRSILTSYESERKLIAENLLNFDAKYASLFSQRQTSAGEVKATLGLEEEKGEKDNPFIEVFKSSCEFTTGYGIAYNPNVFNWSSNHPAQSALFQRKGGSLGTGRVMPPANVTRVSDANVVQLEQEVPFNGSFRVFLFAGMPSTTRRAVIDFASNLMKDKSFYKLYERQDIARVSCHERHNPHSHFFTICTTFTASRPTIEIPKLLPAVLARYSDHVYADDIWDSRVPGAKAAAHAKMGLDQEKGGVVIVRPDGYVGCVVELVEGSGTVDALNQYFGAFSSKPIGKAESRPQL